MTFAPPLWLEALPPLAVSYEVGAPLAPFTTIKVGGAAEVLARPAGWGEVAALMAAVPAGVPLIWLGKGSNMVVADGGIVGVVVHLAKGCDAVRVEGDSVYAEAGADTGKAARAARDAGLTGLEFFGGIPGSVGGALRMNAGAYGHETFDALQQVWLLDETGKERQMAPAELKPRYRGTDVPAGWVFKAGLWRLPAGDKDAIRQRMREINHARSGSQPLHLPSSGSWFKNVVLPHDVAGVGKAGDKVNAWKVVDAAGCRGWREGGAQVSEQHCNFFVNAGVAEGTPATARDLDTLSRRVEAEVHRKLGLVMEREVRFTGRTA